SSIGCAQCHNHKYDPFTQKQFYQMVAFFNNAAFVNETKDPGQLQNAFSYAKQFTEPRLDLPTPDQAQKLAAIEVELNRYEKQLNDASPEFKKRQGDWERQLLVFEKRWQPLRPMRLEASNGTTLTASPDSSILASGKNPDSENCVLEAKAPVGEITAIRIEAL